MELTRRQSGPTPVSVAGIVEKPLPEAEAELALTLDTIIAYSREDPLSALDQILDVMQQFNIELLKCHAPPLLEHAQIRSAEFSTNGDMKGPTRDQARALTSMLKIQESVAKLGAARVKVRDEMDRRDY